MSVDISISSDAAYTDDSVASFENSDIMVLSPNYFQQKHIYTDRGQRVEQKTDTFDNQNGNGGNIKLLYVHEDIMGNTRYHTKDNGQSYAELEYDVWGKPTSPNMLLNNDNGVFIFAQFTGHIYDTVLDIYFAEARFYDAKSRQWMNSDPMKDGLNWYQYVGANPATWVDPWGLTLSSRTLNLFVGIVISSGNNQRVQEAVAHAILLMEVLSLNEVSAHTIFNAAYDIGDFYELFELFRNNASKELRNLNTQIYTALHEITQVMAGAEQYRTHRGHIELEKAISGERSTSEQKDSDNMWRGRIDIFRNPGYVYEVKPMYYNEEMWEEQLNKYTSTGYNRGNLSKNFGDYANIKLVGLSKGQALTLSYGPKLDAKGRPIPGKIGYYFQIECDDDDRQYKRNAYDISTAFNPVVAQSTLYRGIMMQDYLIELKAYQAEVVELAMKYMIIAVGAQAAVATLAAATFDATVNAAVFAGTVTQNQAGRSAIVYVIDFVRNAAGFVASVA